ncbi:MAG: DUF481 domain-containing protein [Thermoanaerobaculia bacterium]
MIRYALTIVIIALVTLPSFAQDAATPRPPVFTDQAELSFVRTSGNTDMTSIAGKNAFTWNMSDVMKLGWKAAILYGETDGEKTAESYATDARLDRLLSPRAYVYGGAGWLKDEFAGFDQRLNAGAGAGYKFLTGPVQFFSAEGGLEWVAEEYIDGTDESYAAARGFGLYEYAFTEKNKFAQSLEGLLGFNSGDNYRLKSETSLIASLTGALSMKASYVVKYNNDPVPETLDTTDTIFGVSLVANF